MLRRGEKKGYFLSLINLSFAKNNEEEGGREGEESRNS